MNQIDPQRAIRVSGSLYESRTLSADAATLRLLRGRVRGSLALDDCHVRRKDTEVDLAKHGCTKLRLSSESILPLSCAAYGKWASSSRDRHRQLAMSAWREDYSPRSGRPRRARFRPPSPLRRRPSVQRPPDSLGYPRIVPNLMPLPS